MRVALVAVALALTACGGQRAAAPGCTLRLGEIPVPRTGEHSLAVVSSCALGATPTFALLGKGGTPLRFTYVSEGGSKNAHTLLFDKYRCDILWRDHATAVRVNGMKLTFATSLMDWCPAEAVSTVVHVYLGGLNAPATARGANRVRSCRALRAATTCDGALAGIPVGAPRFAVVEALGKPSFGGPRCPVWRWPPAGGSVDGARICFAHDRATLVGAALHG